MPDQPVDASSEKKWRKRGKPDALDWLIRLALLAALAYFGLKEPLVTAMLLAVFSPILFVVSAVGFHAAVVAITVLYFAFVISGEIRRRRARRLQLPARPFALRPLSRTISAAGKLRPSLRKALFWLLLPIGLVLRIGFWLVIASLWLALVISVPLGIGLAVDILLSPWVEKGFAPVWLVIAAAYAIVIPRRHRRRLLDHPWFWGRMAFRRIRTTQDRLLAALSAP